MTLRTRIAVTAAGAVAVAFAIAAIGLYVATARTLRAEIDRSLTRIATELTVPGPAGRGPTGRAARGPWAPGARAGVLGGAGGFVQFVTASGDVLGASGTASLPHDDAVAAVAAGAADGFLTTLAVGDRPVRVLTVPVRPGIAAQIARPLDEVEASLAVLRTRLAFSALLAVVLAALLGMLVARRAVGPVSRLTALAEEVAATGDLSRRIEQPGDVAGVVTPGDELDRLTRTFNVMLANLEQARLAQQQLVADASHELRTPLTSLRTNIEVLALDAAERDGDVGAHGLSSADRRRLLDDLTVQLAEFGRLVAALVELARGAQPVSAAAPVQLDELVEVAADRARAFADDGQTITVTTESVVVAGDSDRLDRAIANLLDNAVKYGGGQPITVTVGRRAGGVAQSGDGHGRRGTAVVAVRDHGAGIPPEDLPRVFERFYRAPSARSAAGSGLGLAIVKQVVDAHGGTVQVSSADGGGTLVTIELPAHD